VKIGRAKLPIVGKRVAVAAAWVTPAVARRTSLDAAWWNRGREQVRTTGALGEESADAASGASSDAV
jgi:hypothetical protein